MFERIDYKQGDLVYGLSKKRNNFAVTQGLIKFHHSNDKKEKKSLHELYINIDELNNAFNSNPINTMLTAKCDANLPGDEQDYDFKEKDFAFFHQFKIKMAGATLSAETINKFLRFSPDSEERRDFLKKSCKLGILWTLLKGNKIHFVLDGYDFKITFQKTSFSYSSSELRFIYRNWAYLIKEFPKQIIFYSDYKVVNPPWENPEFKQITQAYLPKHPHKYALFFTKSPELSKTFKLIKCKKMLFQYTSKNPEDNAKKVKLARKLLNYLANNSPFELREVDKELLRGSKLYSIVREFKDYMPASLQENSEENQLPLQIKK